MRNYNVIPGIAILMPKDDEVFWHWRTGIWRLQPIAQLNGFAESGLGEMDMINVRAFASAGGRGALFTGSGLWYSLSLNECNGQQVK
jgi:hypothetical protein